MFVLKATISRFVRKYSTRHMTQLIQRKNIYIHYKIQVYGLHKMFLGSFPLPTFGTLQQHAPGGPEVP